mmetsp:Transcript_47746/g.86342  ORF Transcript_47746/g.86342 Transcript_47746/m.86342 type:complete len:314 (+) Transcript_47746:1522-2463(+)
MLITIAPPLVAMRVDTRVERLSLFLHLLQLLLNLFTSLEELRLLLLCFLLCSLLPLLSLLGCRLVLRSHFPRNFFICFRALRLGLTGLLGLFLLPGLRLGLGSVGLGSHGHGICDPGRLLRLQLSHGSLLLGAHKLVDLLVQLAAMSNHGVDSGSELIIQPVLLFQLVSLCLNFLHVRIHILDVVLNRFQTDSRFAHARQLHLLLVPLLPELREQVLAVLDARNVLSDEIIHSLCVTCPMGLLLRGQTLDCLLVGLNHGLLLANCILDFLKLILQLLQVIGLLSVHVCHGGWRWCRCLRSSRRRGSPGCIHIL